MVTRARIEVLTRTHDEAHDELHDALNDLTKRVPIEYGGQTVEHEISQMNITRRARKEDGAIRYHGRVVGVWRTPDFNTSQMIDLPTGWNE